MDCDLASTQLTVFIFLPGSLTCETQLYYMLMDFIFLFVLNKLRLIVIVCLPVISELFDPKRICMSATYKAILKALDGYAYYLVLLLKEKQV